MAAALSVIVIGGTIVVMMLALRSEPRAAERSADVQQARTVMDGITRELRQGATIISGTPFELTMVTFVNSATCGGSSSPTARQCRVTYRCAAATCSRIEQNPDGSGTPRSRQVVSGLSGDPVFTYSPSAAAASYIGVQMVFPSENGDDSITITDGVSLRNAPADS
jgi:Tfp pilus assembly protein PilW